MISIYMTGRKVFLDTGAFIALAFRRDQNHEKAVKIFQAVMAKNADIVTTNLIVAETYTFLRYNINYHTAIGFLKSLKQAEQASMIKIIYATPEIEKEALKILEKYCDQSISYPDAVSFAVLAQESDIKDVFTFDEHFYLTSRNVLNLSL